MTQNIAVQNNLFDDPSGAMQQLLTTYGLLDLGSWTLSHNLFWNGGMALPTGGSLPPSTDSSKVVGDPQVGPHANVVLPRWDTNTMTFPSGSTSIRRESDSRQLLGVYGCAASPTGEAAGSAAAMVLGALAAGRRKRGTREWPRGSRKANDCEPLQR